MSKKESKLHLVGKVPEQVDDFDDEPAEYDAMEQLELLESLREDMEDLGVTTLAEIIERISELHSQLDKQ
ncbi:hypothetical protein [Dictyobacter kobayashii]|uniref:Uncharacterized protein n=1 Tax=Dictyobacter kobayashii TaxID=2014872 RepID=A0A402ABD2_9CHLR|nr:hypothetical protein [Dictyobacter kobayashii]GCE16351.1 hypothetical protein KDK_01510 [Dictyobacter kobayashii]